MSSFIVGTTAMVQSTVAGGLVTRLAATFLGLITQTSVHRLLVQDGGFLTGVVPVTK